MQNRFRLDVYQGKQEAELRVGGCKETTGKGKREAGGQGTGVSVGGTQHSPDRKQCPPSSAASCASSQGASWGALLFFQPAALLTNTSAFCLAHSYFTHFLSFEVVSSIAFSSSRTLLLMSQLLSCYFSLITCCNV